MASFPENWGTKSSLGLQAKAKKFLQYAKDEPGEWQIFDPLVAAVRYSNGSWVVRRYPGQGPEKYYHADNVAYGVELLRKFWGEQIYNLEKGLTDKEAYHLTEQLNLDQDLGL